MLNKRALPRGAWKAKKIVVVANAANIPEASA